MFCDIKILVEFEENNDFLTIFFGLKYTENDLSSLTKDQNAQNKDCAAGSEICIKLRIARTTRLIII